MELALRLSFREGRTVCRLRAQQGHDQSDEYVEHQGGESEPGIEHGEDDRIDQGGYRGDRDGGERVGVEDLQQFDVLGDDRHQIAPALFLEFGRCESAHGIEDGDTDIP